MSPSARPARRAQIVARPHEAVVRWASGRLGDELDRTDAPIREAHLKAAAISRRGKAGRMEQLRRDQEVRHELPGEICRPSDIRTQGLDQSPHPAPVHTKNLPAEKTLPVLVGRNHEQPVAEPAEPDRHGVEAAIPCKPEHIGMAVVGQGHGLRRSQRQAGPVELAGTLLDRGNGLVECRAALRRETALDLGQAPQLGEILEVPVTLRSSRGEIRLRIRLQRRIEDGSERDCDQGEQGSHAGEQPQSAPPPRTPGNLTVSSHGSTGLRRMSPRLSSIGAEGGSTERRCRRPAQPPETFW